MTTSLSVARVGLSAMACLLLAAGCTSNGDGGDRDSDSIAAGQVVTTSPDDFTVDSRADVPLPSGVLSLGLAPELETDSEDLVAASDTILVGLTWSFTPQPNSEAREVLLNGTDMASLPEPTVTLDDSSGEVTIPVVAEPGRSGGVVVGATDPTALVVTYDGFQQRVSLNSGDVDSGQAEALGDLADATRRWRRTCPVEDFPTLSTLGNGCRVEATHRIPWIAGLGWAPDSQTWLVVDARIAGDATMLMDGREGQTLESAAPSLTRAAYAVAGDAARTIGFDYGAPIGVVIQVPLSD